MAGESPLPRPFQGEFQEVEPPEYWWLDGAEMIGAKLDFAASGFADVHFCPTCGRHFENIPETWDNRRSGQWPYTFSPGSWSGANLFTTDLSPVAFFCTTAVVDCAKEPARQLPVCASGNRRSAWHTGDRLPWGRYGGRIVIFVRSPNASEYRYGYDRLGDVLWKENVVAGNESPAVNLDELYTYDKLGQLTSVTRGDLNSAHDAVLTGTEDFAQSWSLDGFGNWSNFKNDPTATARGT